MNFYVVGYEDLSFEDNFIDLMTVSASFHHFLYVEKFAKEVNRVVKKSGRIYIAEIYLPHILEFSWKWNGYCYDNYFNVIIDIDKFSLKDNFQIL